MKIKIGQDTAQAGKNHKEISFILTIQVDTKIDVQKLKQSGQESNSPKKGNLNNMSSDHSSKVKMSSFDILSALNI